MTDDALRAAAEAALKASAARPSWAKRRMPAIEADMASRRAGVLTKAEQDAIREAYRAWLPVSYEGGVTRMIQAVEQIVTNRLKDQT